MSIEPREALNRLVAALEHHYDVAQKSELVQEAALDSAEDRLQDAFFTYDDSLFTNFGVELPFELLDDEDEDFDEDDDEDDDLLFFDIDEDEEDEDEEDED